MGLAKVEDEALLGGLIIRDNYAYCFLCNILKPRIYLLEVGEQFFICKRCPT